MVKTIGDPGKERVHPEKGVSLPKLIQLWISIEQSSGDELVKDTHHKRRQDGEEQVVERQRPRLVDDLS